MITLVDTVLPFVGVGCTVITACGVLWEFITEPILPKRKKVQSGERVTCDSDANSEVASYDELQQYTNVKLIRLEPDFLVPEEYRGKRLRRLVWIRAALVGALAALSLFGVLSISSWRWAIATSLLYLVVVVIALWFRKSRCRNTDDRNGAA